MTAAASPLTGTTSVPSPRPELASPGLAGATVAGAIARELVPALEQAHALVQEFVQTGRITRAQLDLLSAALDDARTVAEHSQRLAALQPATARPPALAQRLDIRVSQALARQLPVLQRQRVHLHPPQVTPIRVLGDPQVLGQMLDAAFAWCAQPDRELSVALVPSGDLGLAVIRMRIEPGVLPLDEEPALTWHLLQALARSAGVRVQLVQRDGGTLLTLGLQRAPQDIDDPVPHDLSTGQDALMTGIGGPLPHQRVLLVTRDSELRREVEEICETLNITVDWVATGAAADRQYAQTHPGMVLVDARSADAAVARLYQSVHDDDADFPWMEIAHPAAGASLAQWLREEGLTLHNLRSQLAKTLLYGMSRIGPR